MKKATRVEKLHFLKNRKIWQPELFKQVFLKIQWDNSSHLWTWQMGPDVLIVLDVFIIVHHHKNPDCLVIYVTPYIILHEGFL